MSRATALELRDIRKSFGDFLALDGASFSVSTGQVHALLGENGAGKSSLMNIAAGLYAPEAGAIFVDDNEVRFSGPRDAAREHIGMVHQHFKLVGSFTVLENIVLAQPEPASAGSFARRMAGIEVRLREMAATLGFEIDPRQRVDALSVAEQQRLEILKVLLAGARVLILDEPTAVLTDDEAQRLLTTVHALSRRGMAVVLVTHKLNDVKAYADSVTVMRAGRTVATLDPKDTPIADLVRLTVGETASPTAGRRAESGPARLVLRGLSAGAGVGRRLLDDVSLTVHAGEIYGVAGVGGNGQGELAEAILGLPGDIEGEVLLCGPHGGEPLPIGAGHRRRIGFIPADRQTYGLAGSLSVADNFAVGLIHTGRYGSAAWLSTSRMRAEAGTAVQDFSVHGVRSVAQKAALLSGGNAQKLVIAREFSKRPALILVHSPSRGLDARATAEVRERLLSARNSGAAVMLISEDLDEVLALSDRIGVMNGGRIVAEFDQPADRQAVGQAMVHGG